MASFAKYSSLFFLITLLFSLQTHARDSQLFNKIPTANTNNNNNVVPNTNTNEPTLNNQQQDPDFLPENENSYGLYGHETGQLPPSTTTNPLNKESHKQPLNKYLPKNYNTVSYVTEPEGIDNTFTDNNDNSNYFNDAQNYQQERETEYRTYPAANANYYNLGSSFNRPPRGVKETGFNKDSFDDGFQPQGMSDTRSLENGKYHYDIYNEKYSSNHPYERLKSVQMRTAYGNRNNYYKSGENAEDFNNENYDNMGGYDQNQF